jgi:hypothetical protein
LSESEKTFSSRVGGEEGSHRSGRVKAKIGRRQAKDVRKVAKMKAAMVVALTGIQSNGGGRVNMAILAV